MIISTNGLRTVKLLSAKNYVIRLNNKLEKPSPYMTNRVVIKYNLVFDHITLHFLSN